jgi:hypothetical protein
MVAFPEEDLMCRAERLAALLGEAGVTGEAPDHLWMAEGLAEVAGMLDPGGADVWTERLLAAAHLRGLNEGEAAARVMAWFDLPEGRVEAVRELLRAAPLSPEGWAYLRSDICRLERPRGREVRRWEIDGAKLLAVSRVWHELGERVMFRRLVSAFCRWVRYREGNVEVVIRRVPAEAGARWVEELRGALALECGADGLRVEPMIVWEGERVRAARSECRRGA